VRVGCAGGRVHRRLPARVARRVAAARAGAGGPLRPAPGPARAARPRGAGPLPGGRGMTSLTVLDTGPLTTVQDFGRPGRAALGVGRSGACDRGAHRLANALVGNHPTLATLEVTLGGLEVAVDRDVLVVTS